MSFSAGSNSFLIFSSDPPTNLSKISGPFTTCGFSQLRASAIFLAIKVLPVPGGPYKSKPLTCLIPYFYIKDCGYLLELNALLKISLNSLSRPPIPSS